MEGPFHLEYARYRLLFRHPFGTAHGLRDGTDAVFLRLRSPYGVGYGETTLPPYVEEDQEGVIRELHNTDIEAYITSLLKYKKKPFINDSLAHLPAARAALTTAIYDLEARSKGLSVKDFLIPDLRPVGAMATAVTLGHTTVSDIHTKLKELPASRLLKVKLGGPEDIKTLEEVQDLDGRPLLLDANQGWKSLDEAIRTLEAVHPERLFGLEQPFQKHRWDLHAELQSSIAAPIFGDESIQGMGDLERAPDTFRGVNIKLMKCGGLDVAVQMAVRARQVGLKVMFGSMSESSLGCGAMAQIQGLADVLDLDGPWLIWNDPFEGLDMGLKGMSFRNGTGIGVANHHELNWSTIGA
jgi:L-Ala-D/L-Glu epimerase